MPLNKVVYSCSQDGLYDLQDQNTKHGPTLTSNKHQQHDPTLGNDLGTLHTQHVLTFRSFLCQIFTCLNCPGTSFFCFIDTLFQLYNMITSTMNIMCLCSGHLCHIPFQWY